MKRKLHVYANPNQPIKHEQVVCFVHQLEKDIESLSPKLSWDLDSTATKLGVYISSGRNPGSKIVIEPLATARQPGIRLSYSRAGKPVFTAFELCGEPEDECILTQLYSAVADAVVNAAQDALRGGETNVD